MIAQSESIINDIITIDFTSSKSIKTTEAKIDKNIIV
jgi:hypothetical protein